MLLLGCLLDQQAKTKQLIQLLHHHGQSTLHFGMVAPIFFSEQRKLIMLACFYVLKMVDDSGLQSNEMPRTRSRKRRFGAPSYQPRDTISHRSRKRMNPRPMSRLRTIAHTAPSTTIRSRLLRHLFTRLVWRLQHQRSQEQQVRMSLPLDVSLNRPRKPFDR